MATKTQVRTYTVRPGLLDEWVDRWRTLVVPLRNEFGFQIHGSWVDRERSQHLWVISHDGPQPFAEANAEYWASTRRAELGLDPADYLIGEDIREVEWAW